MCLFHKAMMIMVSKRAKSWSHFRAKSYDLEKRSNFLNFYAGFAKSCFNQSIVKKHVFTGGVVVRFLMFFSSYVIFWSCRLIFLRPWADISERCTQIFLHRKKLPLTTKQPWWKWLNGKSRRCWQRTWQKKSFYSTLGAFRVFGHECRFVYEWVWGMGWIIYARLWMELEKNGKNE